MGEGASIAMSGKENISDRYINTLYYIDELSSLSEIGISINIRQTLVGGYYSLLSNEEHHKPRPDYYILYLYKKLIGNKILSSYSNDENCRVYCDCSKEYDGGIVIVIMNLNNQSVEIETSDNSVIKLESKRYEYKISIFKYFYYFNIIFFNLIYLNSDKLDSEDIYLNNKILSINADGSINEIEKLENNGILKVEPYSVVYIIIMYYIKT